jgi:hypothetical protein
MYVLCVVPSWRGTLMIDPVEVFNTKIQLQELVRECTKHGFDMEETLALVRGCAGNVMWPLWRLWALREMETLGMEEEDYSGI